MKTFPASLRLSLAAAVPLAAIACGGPSTTPDSGPLDDSDSRPRPLAWEMDVRHYDISVTFDPAARTATGTVTLHASPRERALNCVALHADAALQVDAARRLVAGEPHMLEIERDQDLLLLCDPTGFALGSEFSVAVDYVASSDGRDHYGLFHVMRPESDLPQFFTQFESQGARLMLPLYDEPFDKATTTVTLTAPSAYTLLSNGNPAGIRTDGSLVTSTWENPDPIPPYLITFVAAELDRLDGVYTRGDGRDVPLTVYTAPGRTEDARYALHALSASLAWFEGEWGLVYPWERYGIVAVDGFQWGGMENKGLTNIGSSYVYWNESMPQSRKYSIFGVIAHELAHEWFGNLVTMSWWPDVWLNEGLASYFGESAWRSEFGETSSLLSDYVGLREWYMEVERGPFTHPIIWDGYESPDDLFDSISYTKGEHVLRMLEALTGHEAFAQGIRDYTGAYGRANADSWQFLDAIGGATEVDVRAFADDWLLEPGFPTVELSWICAVVAGSGECNFGASQTDVAGEPSDWTFPLPIGLDFGGDEPGGTALTLLVDGPTASARFPVSSAPVIVSPNRGGTALVDVRVPGVSDEQLALRATGDSDPYGRGVAIYELVQRFAASAGIAGDAGAADAAEGSGDAGGALSLPTPLRTAFQSTFTAGEWPLIDFAIGRALDSEHPREVRHAMALELAPYARAILASPVPSDAVIFPLLDARRGAISVLGQADDPGDWELLRELAARRDPETEGAAMNALLDTHAPDRFDLFDTVLRRNLDDDGFVRGALSSLAATDDPGVFDRLRVLLADPTIAPADDARVPQAVVGGLIHGNPDAAYSGPGLSFLLEYLGANLDRLWLVADAAHSFQEAASRTELEQARLAAMFTELRARIDPEQDDAGAVHAIDALLESLGIATE